MTDRLRPKVLAGALKELREASGVQLISPIGLSLAALIPLLLSVLIPPAFYSGVVREPNLMFGDMRMIGFYIGCIACHIIGCAIVAKPVRKLRVATADEYKHQVWALLVIPLAVALLLDLVSLAMILKNNPAVISDLLSGRGAEAKENLDTRGALSGAQPLLAAVVWWAAMRLYTLRGVLDRTWARNVRLLIYACVAVGTAVALAKMARYEVMPLFLGLAIVKVRQVGSGRSAWFFLGAGAMIVGLIAVLFLIFAMFRGQEILLTLFGYGPGSFNHLSAVLDGRIQFPSSGNYTTGFLQNLPFANRLSGSTAPTAATLQFLKEFDLTRAAGLNGSMIWITAWGYYYVDLGLGVFLFAVAMGVLSQLAWNGFNRQNPVGMVLYPFMASTIILWSTFYVLCRPQTPIIFAAAFALLGWERFINWRRPPSARHGAWNQQPGRRRVGPGPVGNARTRS